MAETLLGYLIWLVLSVLAAVVSCVLLPKFRDWLTSKTENEKLQAVIADVTSTVQTTVDELEQTMVSKYKEQGRWDPGTQGEVLSEAARRAAESLLDSTKQTLTKNEVNIRDLIVRYIEAYIQRGRSHERH